MMIVKRSNTFFYSYGVGMRRKLDCAQTGALASDPSDPQRPREPLSRVNGTKLTPPTGKQTRATLRASGH